MNQTGNKAPVVDDRRGSVFTRDNFLIMGLGIVVIVVGFILMVGGAPTDPNVFPEDEVYSPRRITLAPLVVIIGFLIEIFAIFRRPKSAEAN